MMGSSSRIDSVRAFMSRVKPVAVRLIFMPRYEAMSSYSPITYFDFEYLVHRVAVLVGWTEDDDVVDVH